MAPSSANRAEFSFRTRNVSWDVLRSRAHQKQPINVLIVGGGIVGAGFLRALALNHLDDIVLIEKNDFASGTSSASSKLIHAGIRYLEQAWTHIKAGRIGPAWTAFRFVSQASRERKILGRIAPGLVQPKPIHLVLGKDDNRSMLSVLAGVWSYYVMQLAQGQFFPMPNLYLSQSSIEKNLQGLKADLVKAVFTFWDSETDDARLVMENLQDANDHGARALNYVELVSYQRGPIVLAKLKNRETGEVIDVPTRLLVNAAGAAVDQVAASGGETGPARVDRVAGSHLDIYPPLTDRSYYVTARDNRLVFLLLRNENGLTYTRVGTTERPLGPEESSDRPVATNEEQIYLKELVQTFFPEAGLTDHRVISTDAGIRPLRSQATASAFEKSREHDILIDGNVCTVIGVKLTDFRRVSEELLKVIPWEDIRIEVSLKPGLTGRVPLRHRKDLLYRESTVEELINRTMALHWGDVMWRRQGLAPRVWRRFDPLKLDTWFEAMAKILNWNPEQARREREVGPGA